MAIEFKLTGTQLIQLPIFSNLNPFEAEALLEISSVRAFSEGQNIFEQGTEGDSLFVILKGTVEILKKVGQEKPAVVAEFGSGAAFGEMTLITDSQSERTASARAKERVKVLIISKYDFQKLIHFGSIIAYKVAFNISKLLSLRLIQADQAILESFETADDSTKKILEDFLSRRKDILNQNATEISHD